MTKIKQIACVDATDFPEEVLDYCSDHEISTHYSNDIVFLEDDGNPLANWLKEQGYEFKDTSKFGGDYIGIIAT
jgi:hypothetical protein